MNGKIPHLEKRNQIDVILTDFRKAIDAINHYLLLGKLDLDFSKTFSVF